VHSPFALGWLTRLPYRELHSGLLQAIASLDGWPPPEEYDRLAALVPRSRDVVVPRFVTQRREAVAAAGGYEQHVAKFCAVPTRPGSWHDFFSMLVWAHFPKLRWALNALHVDPEPGPRDPRNGRAPAQNLAASFDEQGMLVVSSERSLLEELRGLAFKRVFWERREELLATTRFWVIGHGMLESLLEPHPGLVARGLLLHLPAGSSRLELDSLVAQRIRDFRRQICVLDPIPLLGIPGYWPEQTAEFYDDAGHFRFDGRSRRPGANDDLSTAP
jgi:hypothetical protein